MTMLKSMHTTKISASVDPCDAAEIFFTNMLLLGFDPGAMEKKYRIPFNKDMFAVPNKKGFEAVARFLFSRLDDARCQAEFRDCWHVRDKKEEQQFRRVCIDWLCQIAKDDPSSFLPRIGPTLFMTPGGGKFQQFICTFSRYVLLRVMMQENGAKAIKDFLHHPVLTRQNNVMAPVIVNTIMAGSIRQRQKFLELIQASVFMQDEWSKHAQELVKDYRSKIKRIRELEHEVDEEKAKLSERASSSPSCQKSKFGVSNYDSDIQAVKRAEIIQKVRNMWKMFDDFHSTQSVDREIIDSILQGKLDKYKIDASELNVKIPDLLLRRCENELQRRNVDDIYKGGKVNLLSLIHLWNLSLHLYAEKLHETGVPKLETIVPGLITSVQTHRAHGANSKALREKLEVDFLPDLKQSIELLKQELDRELLSSRSPASIRLTSLGLGLLPPTPPVSFEPYDVQHPVVDPLTAVEISRLSHKPITTPDGASQLMRDISNKINADHLRLVQGTPICAPTERLRVHDRMRSNNIPDTSRMNIPDTSRMNIPDTSRMKPNAGQPKGSQKGSHVPVSHLKTENWLKSQDVLEQAKTSQTANQKLSKIHENRIVNKVPKKNSLQTTKSALVKKQGHIGTVIDRADYRMDVTSYTNHTSRHILDIRADKIADAFCSVSPVAETSSGASSFEGVAVGVYEDAFQTRNKLEHTPPSTQCHTWRESLLHDSIGPLSSTHIESPIRVSNREEIDKVAVKLFSLEYSDEEETGADASVKIIPGLKMAFDGLPPFVRTPSTISNDSTIISEHNDSFENQMRRHRQEEEEEKQNQDIKGLDRSEHFVEGCAAEIEKKDKKRKLETGGAGKKNKVDVDFVDNKNEAGMIDKSGASMNMTVAYQNQNVFGTCLDASFKTSDLLHQDKVTHLNDTLQYLQESKTPQLPTLIRWKMTSNIVLEEHSSTGDPQFSGEQKSEHLSNSLQYLQKTKTPHMPKQASRSNEQKVIADRLSYVSEKEDSTDVSLVASEPGYRGRTVDSPSDGMSLPIDLERCSEWTEAVQKVCGSSVVESYSLCGDQSKKSAEEIYKLSEIKSGANGKAVPITELQNHRSLSSNELLRQRGCGQASTLNVGDKNNMLDSSLQLRHDKVLFQTDAQDSKASLSDSNINGLIMRYNKLRQQQDDIAHKSNYNIQHECNENEAPSPLNLDNSPFLKSSGQSLLAAGDFSFMSVVNSAKLNRNSSISRNLPDKVSAKSSSWDEGLDTENFDDIKRLLLETSVNGSPGLMVTGRFSVHHDILTPSPLTEAVHWTDVSFVKPNDSFVNLLDFDDSILVPPSPAIQHGTTAAIGDLVDLQ